MRKQRDRGTNNLPKVTQIVSSKPGSKLCFYPLPWMPLRMSELWMKLWLSLLLYPIPLENKDLSATHTCASPLASPRRWYQWGSGPLTFNRHPVWEPVCGGNITYTRVGVWCSCPENNLLVWPWRIHLTFLGHSLFTFIMEVWDNDPPPSIEPLRICLDRL